MATFSTNALLLISFLYPPPKMYSLNMFVTFLLLKSSKITFVDMSFWTVSPSLHVPLINATKISRQFWFFLLLGRDSSAILTKAQAGMLSAYPTSWFRQLCLPGDCQGRCAVSLMKITCCLSITVEGRKGLTRKREPTCIFYISLWEKSKVPPKQEWTFELTMESFVERTEYYEKGKGRLPQGMVVMHILQGWECRVSPVYLFALSG